MTMSFVLMSPSIEIMLNDVSTISERAFCKSLPSMARSVVMKQSIVAMFGWIMPEPLAMTPKRTFLPPTSISSAADFGCVSVVMMAWLAALLPSSESALTASLTPFSILSIGSVTPMTPVEATMTSSGSQPSALAAISCVALASFAPCSPVQALAQPALATIACAVPVATTAFEAKTGAAATAFCVKVPATTASFSV